MTSWPCQPSAVPRPNASEGGSATISAAAARPTSSRPAPWAGRGASPSLPAVPTSSERSSSAPASGLASARSATAPAVTAAAALEPLTAAEDGASVRSGARLRGRELDAGSEQVGLDPAVEGVAPGGERRRLPAGRLLGRRRPDRDERIRTRAKLARDRARDGHHRDANPLVEADRARGDRPPVQDDGGCTGLGRVSGDGSGIGARGNDSGPAGDAREPMNEEARQLCSRSARRRGLEHERLRRRCGGRQRHEPVEEHAQACADDHANLRGGAADVGGADGEHRRSAGRAADAPEGGAGRPVIAGGGDDERVQPLGALCRPCDRAVGEGRERLDERDQRDPGGIVRVAVAVRVDGALETGEELVGAGVHRVATRGVGLPAGDADRQDVGARRDAAEPSGSAFPDEQTCHLGAVALELGRLRRLGVRPRVDAVVDEVDAVENVAVQVRPVDVHARVEQRNRHAAAGDAGEPNGRPCRKPGLCTQQLRADRGREGRPYRVHALHAGSAFEEGDRARVEDGREAVHRSRVPELGLDDHALAAQVRDELLLGGEGGRRPPALVGVAGEAAGALRPGRRARAR